MPHQQGIKTVAQNRKAWHDYFIEEKYECGIALFGTEVKSIRQGKVNLKESWAQIRKGEVWVEGMHISPYEQGNIFNRDPMRPKKLLLHRNEIRKLDGQVIEAAADLGARPWQTMIRIVIPMSMPGIISGVTMVFLPAMTNYVVLDMGYNSTFIMGSLIGSYFSSYDWHNGSMISVILLLLIFAISALGSRLSREELDRKEGVGI